MNKLNKQYFFFSLFYAIFAGFIFGIFFPYLPNLTLIEIFGLCVPFLVLGLWLFFGQRFPKSTSYGVNDSTNRGSNT